MSLRLLFIKHSLAWPRASGHDVHTYNTMKAMAARGHHVALATIAPVEDAALDGLALSARTVLTDAHVAPPASARPGGTWLQRRFQRYYGVTDETLVALKQFAGDMRADAAIVVGLDTLPLFAALDGVVRVWYAADEWVWHHLSQVRCRTAAATDVREAAIKGLYERAHRRLIDRVWVVSQPERTAMRWFAGMRCVDVLPHGVDCAHFTPSDPVDDRSLVFWGRLDFGPNIQALEWFARKVWPHIRSLSPDARFTVAGFHPSNAVRRLAMDHHISLASNVPDLRDLARSHALAVLPFVSGGGIKNKLLEAAAMGLPIVCTTRATSGLRSVAHSGITVTDNPSEMARVICDLWEQPQQRAELGAAVRRWVAANHTWDANAKQGEAAILESIENGKASAYRGHTSRTAKEAA